jgi:hypothetical protein
MKSLTLFSDNASYNLGESYFFCIESLVIMISGNLLPLEVIPIIALMNIKGLD